MLTIESRSLWPRIDTIAAKANRKLAAVAYVSTDDHIQFGKGDVLVVDASNRRIAAGETSAKVLARALQRKATLYSLKNLHAKLFVLDKTAVIGSANVSKTGHDKLYEAAVVSDDPRVVKRAERVISRFISQAKRLDQPFVDRILEIPVVITGGVGGAYESQKFSLIDLLRADSPVLDQYAFILYEPHSTLKVKQIREAAKQKKLALPPRKWTWYDNDNHKGVYRRHERLFQSMGMTAISIEVVTDEKGRIIAFSDIDEKLQAYVNQLKVGRKLVCNFVDQSKNGATFRFSKREFLRTANERLKRRPWAGAKFFDRTGWVLTAKQLARLLGLA